MKALKFGYANKSIFAKPSGVYVALFWALLLAPFMQRSLQILKFATLTAMWRGVFPSSFTWFILAPKLSKNFIEVIY